MEHILEFSALDRHFARFLTALAGQESSELYWACALLSNQTAQGHICLDLKFWGSRNICDSRGETLYTPEVKYWQEKLAVSGVVGTPGAYKPLIMDERGRLYLLRYWEYENMVVERIRRLAQVTCSVPGPYPYRSELERLFPEIGGNETDWQKIAALIACLKPFIIISGSPGTGKTSTVARILALLLEQTPEKRQRIALAAPTGKAAMRLQEAVGKSKQALLCTSTVKAGIPDEAMTVHRLLGAMPGTVKFRHNRDNPLPFDIVVVDEASMLDLPLLAKLLQALPEEARLILLGDKNQLASVEAGAVLGDLCGAPAANWFSNDLLKEISTLTDVKAPAQTADSPGLQDCIVELQKNYRFSGRSDIRDFSDAVNSGKGDQLMQSLETNSYENVHWFPLPEPPVLVRSLAQFIVSGFRKYLELIQSGAKWEDIFSAFEEFKILCALRQGPYGAIAINRLIENVLAVAGLIEKSDPYYIGKPVMITRNSASHKLYNGDVGLMLTDSEGAGKVVAVFPEGQGRFRQFYPLRLPEFETVFAMTVHKSQGSEFDTVLLLLSRIDAPILTRELVYTGITRARRCVMLWSSENVFIKAVSRSIARTSGLREALWPSHPENHS